MKVRSAGPGDRAVVLRIVGEAFATAGRDGRAELDIVEMVWALEAASDGLELVASIDGIVAGYVLGSWGDLEGRPVVGVAPLAVRPAFQGLGAGTVLMRDIIERAERSELPVLVLLGDPGYYRRFGFESSAPLGIFYEPVGPENPHFQVRRFSGYTPTLRGAYRYAWEIERGK